ncbi:MAG: phosphoribosylglycinamide formyltransferase [Planctomycetes bacterium]|nr:phosphoribosylglycinamide formyltransferase [Planctomycetota bacterium]MCB9887440.1 phosphoribosylglycinamide formyltransferase [Planctomycetota bacterium]
MPSSDRSHRDNNHAGHQRPRLGVLLSGSGRTLKNLLERIADGRLRASVAGVASDRDDAFGLQRAIENGLETRVLPEPSAMWSWLLELDVDLVILAGYLRLLPIVPEFEGRVLNIHPSLLPKHGGKGMYGERVHRAVLEAGERESGCTVHLCDDEYDRGRVLIQARVPVLPDDTATSLAARVFAAECEAYPAAIHLRWAELGAHDAQA